MKTSIYFPARNEANNLQALIPLAQKLFDEVIVVSNKSTDDTILVAQSLGAIAVEDNRTKDGIGYGYAHQTGMEWCSGDFICTADADMTYPIEKFNDMIRYMTACGLDFVTGNRYPRKSDSKASNLLKLGTKILSTEAQYIERYPFQDILSGMWVVRKEALGRLKPQEGDWNFSPEIKILAQRKLQYGEYPIDQKIRGGVSKQQYLKTGLSHALWIWRNKTQPYTDSQFVS